MTLNQIYEILRIKYKEQTLAVDEFNAILRGVNLRKLNIEVGKLEEGQAVMDSLSFLKKSATLTIDAQGLASNPSDYFRKLSVSKAGVDIQVVPEDALQEVLNSPLYPPTATDAICTFRAGKIQFYPITLATADLLYLRYPATPVYVFEDLTIGVPLYKPTASTEFEWPESVHMDLLDLIFDELNNKSQVEHK